MQYVIFRSGGKQYKVQEGDILEIDKLEPGKNIVTFGEVLLLVKDGQVEIGTPFVEDTKIRAKIIDQIKGSKIKVSKFKSKVRYRRVIGFRSLLTRVQIEKIEAS